LQDFSNEKFHFLIAKHLIMTSQPFEVVESSSFLELQGYGRSKNATVPKADTMKRLILKMYGHQRNQIAKNLEVTTRSNFEN